jgi:hypothetical protein
MKNIQIISTYKPSRLGRFIDTGKLFLRTDDDIPRGENINIYITVDEEIKEGDWCLDLRDNSVFKIKLPINGVGLIYKIILTTDQDLIKDGVQAIDDEFLEWFVKNPSCETIDINSIPNSNWGFDLEEPMNLGYKIIIPKEEFTTIKGGDDIVFPSSTTITVFKPLPDVNWESDITNKVWDEEEPKQIKCYCGHTITCDCEPLQETLEEAAEIYIQSKNPQWTPYHKQSFKDGAKWQQERMEEDMINFAHFYFKEEFNSTMQTNKTTKELLSEWFEQNKKKFG